MAAYPTVPLREVCEAIEYGFTASSTSERVGPRFLRITDIAHERLDWDAVPFCKIEPEKLAKHRLQTGDIVIARTGATTGWAKFIKDPPDAVFASYLVRIKPAATVDARFVGFVVESQVYKDFIQQHMGGAAQPNANAQVLTSYAIPCPQLAVQRRIADILSAYEELMENSQRRIRILESMARAIYREWFVHFRFPGHETHPRVASPLGEIPQGWEVCALGNLVQLKPGFAFKSGTFTADGEHRLVTIRNVQDGAFNPESDSRMSELPPNLPPYCVLKDGDILLSLTGNVGRVCLVYDGPFLLNQRVSKLAPAEAFDWAMTYCMFRESEMRVKLEQLSNGAAQQNLSPVLASKMQLVRPPRELRQRFAELAEPMVRSIVRLYSTIQNLRRTRDLLLPRLLSGQVALEA